MIRLRLIHIGCSGLLLVLVSGPLIACFAEGEDSDGGWPQPTSPQRNTPTPMPARPAYQNVDATWAGREAYFVCVEDLTGLLGDAALRDRIESPVREHVLKTNPGLPVVVDVGCVFDFPDGPVSTRANPGRYVLQIYSVPSTQQLTSEIGEHWFRGNSDSATPITFLVRLPVDMTEDDLAVASALGPYLGPEPTQKRY